MTKWPYTPTGYHMIRSVEIKNFRGIQHALIQDARRINVLVGPNATGKTAFLEGIFLASGSSPELIFRTRQWRGREQDFAGSAGQIYDAMWADTFRDTDLGEASIILDGDANERRSLEIKGAQPQKLISSSGEEVLGDLGLKFIWDGPKGRQEVVPRIVEGKLEIGTAPSNVSVHFIPARINVSEVETARSFSRLRVEGKAAGFEKAFLDEFSMLSDLSVEAPWGPAAIYARLRSGRKLPLTMISSGINQLAAMMLRLAANPRCVLLIDEIENGFFHDRYESIWRTIYDLSVAVDGQIFATTHSIECLEALATALKGKSNDVRFIRTRLRENEVSIEEMSGETLFKAIEVGEVR